jgi:hypothetical protein
VTRNPFLSGEFLNDQFPRDSQRGSRMMAQSLSAPQLGI